MLEGFGEDFSGKTASGPAEKDDELGQFLQEMEREQAAQKPPVAEASSSNKTESSSSSEVGLDTPVAPATVKKVSSSSSDDEMGR